MVALQADRGDVGQVGTTRLLVDGTQVELWVSNVFLEVDGKDVDDGNGDKQHLRSRLSQTSVLLVPPGTVEVEAVDVDTFSWGRRDVLLHHPCHFVVDNDTVQSPAFVCSSHLLSHGRDEALRIEEASHPERVWSSFKDPATKLGISL